MMDRVRSGNVTHLLDTRIAVPGERSRPNAAVPDDRAARYAGPAAALAAGTSRPITSRTATVSSQIQNTP